ncbi:hypothetical protein ACE6H2_020474 [Prunus campanulata]
MDLVSSVSATNHSSGRNWLKMQDDGNLVSYQINISIPEAAYWASNTYGDMKLSLKVRGFLVLLPDGRGSEHPLATGSYDPRNNRTIIYRATLDADGIFRLYLHNYSVMSRSSRVLIVWSNLHDQCEGCYKNGSDDGCTGNEGPRLRYNMASIDHMLWPGDHPSSVVRLEKLRVCSDSCLEDCSCKAVLYINGSCNKYKLPLRYGRTSKDMSATGFIKVAATHNLQFHNPMANRNSTLVKYETKNSRGLIVILAVSLGSIACICFAFAVSSFTIYVYRLKRYKKLFDHAKVGLAEELFSLQSFSYSELEDDDPGLRPLMKNVILMLEGTTDIPVPSPELPNPKPVDF